MSDVRPLFRTLLYLRLVLCFGPETNYKNVNIESAIYSGMISTSLGLLKEDADEEDEQEGRFMFTSLNIRDIFFTFIRK